MSVRTLIARAVLVCPADGATISATAVVVTML